MGSKRGYLVVSAVGAVLIAASGFALGTGAHDVAQLSAVAQPRGADQVGKVATRIRANEAASAWETFAYLQYEAGELDLAKREGGQVVDPSPQPYINRFGPESSFVVEGENGDLGMVAPDEMTALQEMAFHAWLQNPLVIEKTEPLVRDLLEGSTTVGSGDDNAVSSQGTSTTSTTNEDEATR